MGLDFKKVYSRIGQSYELRCCVSAETDKKLFKIVQELCESRGGRPGLSVLTSLLVSVDVKLY